MNWKDRLNQAAATLKDVVDSDSARQFTAQARQKAAQLTARARAGALDAAQAFVQANSDPSTVTVQLMNARLSIVAPSDGLEIARPNAGTLIVSDGENNGLVVNAAAKPAYVADTIGTVARLNANTYDLGPQDGINVVVLEP